MAGPVFDPELPRNNSPVGSAELRAQFEGLDYTLREILGQMAASSALNS